MSVLVPSFPSSSINSHSHFLSNHYINKTHSQTTKHMSLTTQNLNNDQVPFGVVNSMKQRLLDKFNESLLLNTHNLISKSSNENLLQLKSNFSPLKQTTRLSRSQDNLLNNPTEQLTSYLQPKHDLIIVDTTISNEHKTATHRLSYTELHIDEVPKPGTVSIVKNMFERQIRLSRHDYDKSFNTSTRINNQQGEDRSRSISPNDMALRQRRATAPIPIINQTPYPDLVISHTPLILPHSETMKMSNEESLINTQKNELSSSDTADNQILDFKSRLALFNGTSTIKQSFQQTHSISVQSNFITKPIVHHHHHHHHQTEKKDLSTDFISRSVINTPKSITFFGGKKIEDNTKSIEISSIEEQTNLDETSIDLVHVPNIIGGNVKLNKSSIFSGIKKKDVRVQFIDNVNTFEYPSSTIIINEDNNTDSDDVNDDELEQLARINAEFNSNKLLEPKGTLHTFRPTYLDQYELGTQHGSIMSDKFSREKYFSLSENFSNHEINNNHVQWSSMSTTTDLLF